MFRVGVAKADITPDCIGVGMLGYGDPFHRVKGVKTPLLARAVVIGCEDGTRLIHVCAEICFITEALRQSVFEKLLEEHPALGLKDEELLLVATHTHNAPGGHSSYLLYNLTIPGFIPAVFAAYRDGIVRAIKEACEAMVPAELRAAGGEFGPDSKVAFNRSLVAWARNPEAAPGREIDRRMTVLRIDRADGPGAGAPLGCLVWFPVHCTSIHADFPYIHSDNKGLAARLLEEEARRDGADGFVAVFAQGAAGDVSPNWVKYPGLRDLRGPFPDSEKSCEFNAQLQVELARHLLLQARETGPLTGPISARFERHDFSKLEVAPEFCGGRPGIRTGPATIGCNFMRGTQDGRGVPWFMAFLARLVARGHQYARYIGILLRGRRIPPPWRPDPVQGPKVPFMETGRGRVLGASKVSSFVVPGWVHPTVANLKALAKVRKGRERFAFTPQVVPLQLVALGRTVLVAVPAEFTTVSGARLTATVREALGEMVDRVILSGYANAYTGYVTTYEEYQVQAYEGASTHFGMWTLAGYQTVIKGLCERFRRDMNH